MLLHGGPGCSYLHAHTGVAFRNDKNIIYREAQTTIKYLVVLKSNEQEEYHVYRR